MCDEWITWEPVNFANTGQRPWNSRPGWETASRLALWESLFSRGEEAATVVEVRTRGWTSWVDKGSHRQLPQAGARPRCTFTPFLQKSLSCAEMQKRAKSEGAQESPTVVCSLSPNPNHVRLSGS